METVGQSMCSCRYEEEEAENIPEIGKARWKLYARDILDAYTPKCTGMQHFSCDESMPAFKNIQVTHVKHQAK
jgi:hypothetical protein